ncbi:MAG TPA: DUF1800 domain-containing protein [Opitutus sp.]|nr:DUF1800 domain-containing protein [Opitutus sp.]
MNFAASSAQAWEPLAASEWNRDAARHLLRRVGWTARLEEVERACDEGIDATLERCFPSEPAPLPKTEMIARFEADLPDLLGKIRTARGPAMREARREMRERAQAALQDFRLKWLQRAAEPAQAAFAKWTLFLSDVYVVSAEKVRSPDLLWRHHEILARHALGPAPVLTKAVSRSPAMVRYLDLDRSVAEAPNENFARELFELFVLGEGHYAEADIKEAARAFTGYRVQAATGEFRLVRQRQDAGRKTIFGRTGRFSGDDVIDLAYAQPAAATFLPGELARFYLSDRPLPAEMLPALGERWREQRFELRALALTFFRSRAFFAPENRGNFIKSPVQFYLGALQDLELEVIPLTRFTLNPLRQMGQQLFQPPNVRGWVGGRSWINSTTFAARRNLVQQLFAPLREETLNADDVRALAEARKAGRERFTVGDDWFERWSDQPADETVGGLAQRFLAAPLPPHASQVLVDFLERRTAGTARRDAVAALLQLPEYQLC